MKVLWIASATGRRSHKEVADAKATAALDAQRAESLRRAQRRAAQVAAAVASIPVQGGPVVAVPAQRSPMD